VYVKIVFGVLVYTRYFWVSGVSTLQSCFAQRCLCKYFWLFKSSIFKKIFFRTDDRCQTKYLLKSIPQKFKVVIDFLIFLCKLYYSYLWSSVYMYKINSFLSLCGRKQHSSYPRALRCPLKLSLLCTFNFVQFVIYTRRLQTNWQNSFCTFMCAFVDYLKN